MKVLFVENRDSFSWNVIDGLPCGRAEVRVRDGRAVGGELGLVEEADVVVIGPGPTDPVRAGLLPIVRRAERAGRPLLGICLGHQALGLAFGARLVRGVPVHGKRSAVRFRPSRLFPGIVGEEPVMRYHSLVLEDVRAPLSVVAATPEGLPMAIEHAALRGMGAAARRDRDCLRVTGTLLRDRWAAREGRTDEGHGAVRAGSTASAAGSCGTRSPLPSWPSCGSSWARWGAASTASRDGRIAAWTPGPRRGQASEARLDQRESASRHPSFSGAEPDSRLHASFAALRSSGGIRNCVVGGSAQPLRPGTQSALRRRQRSVA